MRKIGMTLVAGALIASGSPGGAQQAAPSRSVEALSAKAQAAGGSLRVIVRLAAAPPAGASDADMARAIRRAGEAVVADVLGAGRDVTYMATTPMFVTRASAQEIARLAADPRVASVDEDGLARPSQP